MRSILILLLLFLPAFLAADTTIVVGRAPAAAAGPGFAEVGSGSQRAASTSKNGVDSGTLAFPGSPATGNLLIVAGTAWGSTAAPTSVAVTDTLTTSYTVVLGTVPSGLTWRNFIAYGVTTGTGANTVTVNPAGADGTHSFSWSQDEFSGQHGTPADVNGGIGQGTGTAVTDSITTVATNALVIGVMSHDGGNYTLTAGGSYTLIGENETNSGNQCHNAVFRIVTTATAYTVDWTIGTSTAWGCQTHSFKPL